MMLILKRRSKDSHKFLPKKENRQRLKLYHKGYNDAEISREVGVTKEAIKNWRDRNSLKSNNPATSQSVLEKRLKRWRKGWTDRQMADAENCDVMRVVVWRNRKDLRPN